MRMYRFQLVGDKIVEDSGEVERSPHYDGDGMEAYTVVKTTPESQYFRNGYRWYNNVQNFSIDRAWALNKCRSSIRGQMNECLEVMEMQKKSLLIYNKALKELK
jgi:hypothetical protein